MSASEWTPESVSEFSERQPFLNGASTPPPQYPGSRPSIALSVDEFDPLNDEVGDLLSDAPPRTVCDDPRKGRRGCRGRRQRKDGLCKSRYTKGERFRVVISVVFICFLLGFIVGFVITRKSTHRHDASFSSGRPRPSWANEDCDRKDGDYNHYEFNDVHDLEISDGPHGAFSGTIRVLPALPGQTADLILKQVAKKTKALDIRVNGGRPAHSMKGRSAAPSSSLVRRRSCNAQVIMHFREGVSINDLRIDTHGGHIQVYSPLQVKGSTHVNTKSGRIDADSFFNTRRTFISSGSSSLQGHFKLYDLLSISSTSGVIDVTVEPQEADPKNPKPAELVVDSRSGMVNLGTTRTPLAREYITTVESRDGQIHGTILHGSKTLIKSQSGQINLDVVPYSDKPSNLHISSASGRQQINVLSPIAASSRSGSLGRMQSTHTSQSGAMQLSYPPEWAGKIDGSTSSGSIEVRGVGVDVIDKGQHYIRAEKDAGEGKSELIFRGQSGSVGLRF